MPWVAEIWIPRAIGELVQNRIDVEALERGIEQFDFLLSVACGAMGCVAVLDLVLDHGIANQSTWSEDGDDFVWFDED